MGELGTSSPTVQNLEKMRLEDPSFGAPELSIENLFFLLLLPSTPGLLCFTPSCKITPGQLSNPTRSDWSYAETHEDRCTAFQIMLARSVEATSLCLSLWLRKPLSAFVSLICHVQTVILSSTFSATHDLSTSFQVGGKKTLSQRGPVSWLVPSFRHLKLA